MSKVTFEDFLMGRHAQQYTGTKDCMVDDCADWIANLDCDDFIEYGDLFAKEQSKGLIEALKELSFVVKKFGIREPNNLTRCLNAINNSKQAIAKAIHKRIRG